jgi:Fe-S-cluster-containing dehydrogenase component
MSDKENSRPGVSRRAFLRALGIGTAAAASAATPVRALAIDDIGTVEHEPGEELVTVFDLAKCIGCEECVYACKEVNAHKHPEPKKPFPKMYPSRVPVADWSDRRDVIDRLTPYTWVYIQRAEVEHEGKVHALNIPRRCMHCVNPACADLCPFGSARKQLDGIVRIHEDQCLGGAKCKKVCPWSIPERQTGVGLYLKLMPQFAGNGAMYKCDRCFDRVAEGKLPACVEVCPVQAQAIGPRSEMVALAERIAQERNGYLYGLEENGGTNTIYVSAVPFEKLNAAVEKGKGKPHFKPVKNTLALAEKLAWGVLAAPLAGIAAGIAAARKGGDRD